MAEAIDKTGAQFERLVPILVEHPIAFLVVALFIIMVVVLLPNGVFSRYLEYRNKKRELEDQQERHRDGYEIMLEDRRQRQLRLPPPDGENAIGEDQC